MIGIGTPELLILVTVFVGIPVLWLVIRYRCDWCQARHFRPVRFKVDGGLLCSLRCKNAYEASKDIKEARVRIVDGE